MKTLQTLLVLAVLSVYAAAAPAAERAVSAGQDTGNLIRVGHTLKKRSINKRISDRLERDRRRSETQRKAKKILKEREARKQRAQHPERQDTDPRHPEVGPQQMQYQP